MQFRIAAAALLIAAAAAPAPAVGAEETYFMACYAFDRTTQLNLVTPIWTVVPAAIHPGWNNVTRARVAESEQYSPVMDVSYHATDDLPAQFKDYTERTYRRPGNCVAATSADRIQNWYQSFKANTTKGFDKTTLRSWKPDHPWIVASRDLAN